MVDVATTLVIAAAMGAAASVLTYEILRFFYGEKDDDVDD